MIGKRKTGTADRRGRNTNRYRPPLGRDRVPPRFQKIGLSPQFAQGLELLTAYVSREGNARVPPRHHEGNFLLGVWVVHRRGEHRLGFLSPEKVHLLERFPGWSWDPREDDFWRGLALVKKFAKLCRLVSLDYAVEDV